MSETSHQKITTFDSHEKRDEALAKWGLTSAPIEKNKSGKEIHLVAYSKKSPSQELLPPIMIGHLNDNTLFLAVDDPEDPPEVTEIRQRIREAYAA
ncbi:MAG: hypothetical protein WC806_05210 [Candidatus Gracilibacteria bacterium]|jgi:hypothetical protein